MGAHGPVPKRVDKRLGHQTKAQKDVDVPITHAAPPPELPGRASLDPIAVGLWDALVVSAEAEFYTAVVWRRAIVHVHMLSATLTGASAAMYATLQADWKSLLIDPAEQRRLGIEVAPRAKPRDPDAERSLATVTSLMDKLA